LGNFFVITAISPGIRKIINRSLTQQRFADELEQISNGRYIYTAAAISNWEKTPNTLRFDDRGLLISQLKVLNKFDGINSLTEANRLLRAGHYLELQRDEISAINESWLVEENQPIIEIQTVPSATPWLIFLSSIGILFKELRFPASRQSQQTVPLWSPARIFILACWFGATILVWRSSLPLLYWPLQEPLATAVIYALSTIIIPALIALFVWMDQQRFWQELQKPRIPGFLWTLVGALIGFNASYLFIFAILLVLNDFALPNLGDLSSLLQFLTALPVVFCTVFGARQVPLEILRTFDNIHFSRRDTVVLIILVLIGPIVGIVFYHTYSLLLDQPLAGTLVILIVVLALSGFTIWQERRAGTSAIPASSWAILIGMFWILYVLATGELYQVALVMITIVAVVIGLWIWESRRV